MKITTIIGARPQFIKAAVVSRKLREREGMQEVMLHTLAFDANIPAEFFDAYGIRLPKGGDAIVTYLRSAQE